jgi:N4-gp56 family major capsid protein
VPDTYTGQATLPYDQQAFDLLAYYALRPELYFDAVADIQPSQQAMPGSSVTFSIQNDLAVVSTPLSESVDVSAVPMSASQVTLSLAEYGNAIITTALGRGTSFLDWDRLVANVIGFNAGISLDTLAQIVLAAATNVFYCYGDGSNNATSPGTVTPKNTLVAQDIRRARATLRRANVPTIDGYYFAFVHPDQAYDLMGQTGSATWNEPRAYNAPDDIFTGELGSFQGFRFIETPRSPFALNAGSSPATTTVFSTIFLGRQALAKAFSYVDGNDDYPVVIPGPITDHLRRQVPWGWYWLGVYGIFRQASILIGKGASSIN